jgi:hypothetical protein
MSRPMNCIKKVLGANTAFMTTAKKRTFFCRGEADHQRNTPRLAGGPYITVYADYILYQLSV